MRILVTGGAGFIGSHICDGLLNAGHQVRCIDNLSTGFASNIAHLQSNPNFEFIQSDITNAEKCVTFCKDIDAISHQAALGSVPRSIEKPLNTHANNATGFINLLHAAKQQDIKRFVYASSSSVYGDHPDLPKVEEKVGNPLSPYAITKKTNELYAKVYAELHGMQVVGLRYFNVFGPRQSPQGAYAAVIPKFVELLKNHKAPIINGDGTQLRDFTNVANVVQANMLALTTTKKECFNQVFNVACGKQTNLIELFETIRTILTKQDAQIANIEPIHAQPRAGDIQKSFASIDKITKLLGYHPTLHLKEGLEQMLSL